MRRLTLEIIRRYVSEYSGDKYVLIPGYLVLGLVEQNKHLEAEVGRRGDRIAELEHNAMHKHLTYVQELSAAAIAQRNAESEVERLRKLYFRSLHGHHLSECNVNDGEGARE